MSTTACLSGTDSLIIVRFPKKNGPSLAFFFCPLLYKINILYRFCGKTTYTPSRTPQPRIWQVNHFHTCGNIISFTNVCPILTSTITDDTRESHLPDSIKHLDK